MGDILEFNSFHCQKLAEELVIVVAFQSDFGDLFKSIGCMRPCFFHLLSFYKAAEPLTPAVFGALFDYTQGSPIRSGGLSKETFGGRG
jgi:hypothetical protein